MQEIKEINALLHLMDDPDEEVFATVSTRLEGYGKEIIPVLENCWETTPDTFIQGRIEMLIHKLHFNDLLNDFKEWHHAPQHDLLLGALLVGKYQYPDLSASPVYHQIEKIRQTIWLELNQYQTPLEQLKIVSAIFYSYFRFKTIEKNNTATNSNDFLIHKALEAKKGNHRILSLLLHIICGQLGLPVYTIKFPNQLLLAYIKQQSFDDNTLSPQQKISYYLNPANGMIFSNKEVDVYYKKNAIAVFDKYFAPLHHKEIIINLIKNLAESYTDPALLYKQADLKRIVEQLAGAWLKA